MFQPFPSKQERSPRKTRRRRLLGSGQLLAVLVAICLILAGCETGQNTIEITASTADGTTAAGESLPTTAPAATSAGSPSESGSPSQPGDPSATTAPTTGTGTGGTSATAPGGTTAPSQTTTPTTASTTAVTPGSTAAIINDPIIDAYFGPLPKAAQVKSYQHNELRAIYIGAGGNLDKALEIARKTEVNAIVLDLKESDGIKYASTVPLAVSIGAVKPAFDLKKMVERCHAENVKVIGRIVCFKDPILAEARPDMTIRDKDGKTLLYTLEGRKPFVSPYDKNVWQYNIDLAREAAGLGVDEIQFDYIRFPTGGSSTGASSWFGEPGKVPSRIQAINRFIQTARVQIQDELGVPLGIDVFAIIVSSKADSKNLGQDWASLGMLGADSVSPMIYPSHYANASKGHYSGNGKGESINGKFFTKPDLFPYEVMFNALTAGKSVEKEPGYKVVNRPWLQAFTASYLPSGYYMNYGAAEIRAQIKAIRDAGYKEWICWNPRAAYPIEAFDPQS